MEEPGEGGEEEGGRERRGGRGREGEEGGINLVLVDETLCCVLMFCKRTDSKHVRP